jgi:hypothetical protein
VTSFLEMLGLLLRVWFVGIPLVAVFVVVNDGVKLTHLVG